MARRDQAKVAAEIDATAQARQEAWAAGDPKGVAPKLSQRLESLYEERRHLVNGVDREQVVKRARVETELERLMSG